MHNVEDLLGKFADTSYPFLIPPRLLEHPDPFIANCFRGELKRHQPELWEWKWMDGSSCEIKELPKEKFHDPAMWYINQEYRIGCGRLKESFEHSYLINWVDLGNGYRIHVAGFCPETMTRKYDHVFLVDFLYRKKDWHEKESHDGVIRLRRFLSFEIFMIFEVLEVNIGYYAYDFTIYYMFCQALLYVFCTLPIF